MAEEFTRDSGETCNVVSEAAEANSVGFEEEALPHLDAVYRFALRLSGCPRFGRGPRAGDLPARIQVLGSVHARHRGEELALHDLPERLPAAQRAYADDTIRSCPRTSGRRAGAASGPVNPVWSSVVGIDPEGDFFDSIVDDRIVEAINELPEEYRTAVVLSDFEGLPYAEIAELMEVPVGTVKSRLFRGRRQLQQVLYEYAVEMGYIAARTGTDES